MSYCALDSLPALTLTFWVGFMVLVLGLVRGWEHMDDGKEDVKAWAMTCTPHHTIRASEALLLLFIIVQYNSDVFFTF